MEVRMPKIISKLCIISVQMMWFAEKSASREGGDEMTSCAGWRVCWAKSYGGSLISGPTTCRGAEFRDFVGDFVRVRDRHSTSIQVQCVPGLFVVRPQYLYVDVDSGGWFLERNLLLVDLVTSYLNEFHCRRMHHRILGKLTEG
jgi:hypothetical protein